MAHAMLPPAIVDTTHTLGPLEPGWDKEVEKPDRPLLDFIVRTGIMLGTYKAPRPLAKVTPQTPQTPLEAEDSDEGPVPIRLDEEEEDPDALPEYWIIPNPEGYAYTIVWEYPMNVVYAHNRDDTLFARDRFRTDPFSLQSTYNREKHRTTRSVRVLRHDHPQIPFRWVTHLQMEQTVMHHAPMVEGVNVKRTKDGAYISNLNSPRAPKRPRSASTFASS
jgi:hypothetical protein